MTERILVKDQMEGDLNRTQSALRELPAAQTLFERDRSQGWEALGLIFRSCTIGGYLRSTTT